MTTKIILDCDPGHDDAVAILLAAGNSNIELLGVTTVGGNHTLEKVTRNAAQVLTVAKLTDVPLYAGATRPILREVETAEGIHGDTGMEIHGFELPEPALSVQEKHGVQFIIDTIMSEPAGTVTLVPTGPLTNIALAARLEPRIVERVKEVVLMGGAYGTGNWTPSAEFNIIVDPEAAHIVFNEKWPVVMVGLDLTHQALATKEVEEQFAALGTNVGDFVWGSSVRSARITRTPRALMTRQSTTRAASPTSSTQLWWRRSRYRWTSRRRACSPPAAPWRTSVAPRPPTATPPWPRSSTPSGSGPWCSTLSRHWGSSQVAPDPQVELQ